IRHWLLQWFNPHPDHLGTTLKDFDRFFQLVNKRTEDAGEDLPLVTGDDFAQGLFYREPKSDSQKGLW
ncbi:hypothetical protein LN429_26830, partial [Pseudomonas syringae]